MNKDISSFTLLQVRLYNTRRISANNCRLVDITELLANGDRLPIEAVSIGHPMLPVQPPMTCGNFVEFVESSEAKDVRADGCYLYITFVFLLVLDYFCVDDYFCSYGAWGKPGQNSCFMRYLAPVSTELSDGRIVELRQVYSSVQSALG